MLKKYPRTYHVPWSLGSSSDDKILKDMEFYHQKRVVVTEKLDGENTSLYNNYIHARSLDSKNHETRNWVKNFWSSIKCEIPDGWRICGENMYAKHSIFYDNLESYFYGFSIWDETNYCLSWNETLEYFNYFGITCVPVLYDGIYDEELIKSLWNESKWNQMEGYVIRLVDSFSYKDFNKCVSKFVRRGHVQTAKHWAFGQKIEKNALKF